ncbi:unnamed protein product, partial [Ectocarpus sp. 8 AP-2014]
PGRKLNTPLVTSFFLRLPQSHTERALRHYVLDGFVTAHVALHQGMSRAYLYLSGFERDAKRRQAMCTRRCA